MEKAAWYASVFEAVSQVPNGKVTTYGHIARLIGRRKLHRRNTVSPFTIHVDLHPDPYSGMSKVRDLSAARRPEYRTKLQPVLMRRLEDRWAWR